MGSEGNAVDEVDDDKGFEDTEVIVYLPNGWRIVSLPDGQTAIVGSGIREFPGRRSGIS